MSGRVGLTSCANDTKWRELRNAMIHHLGRAPLWLARYLPPLEGDAWQMQAATGAGLDYTTFGPDRWDGEWYYHFQSDNDWKCMEWVDLKPRPGCVESGGMQLPEIASICGKIGLDADMLPERVRVYGYRRHG